MENTPNTSFVATNVVNTKSFEIKTPDVTIKVAPDKTYLVENRMIEGRPCIVIAINEHVEINGISCRPVSVQERGGSALADLTAASGEQESLSDTAALQAAACGEDAVTPVSSGIRAIEE